MTHVLCQIFQEKSFWNGIRYVKSHAHRLRQCQPGRVPQVGTSNFKKHMFYIRFFKRPFPIDFSWKIGYKTCAMCVFENMTYPLVGLGLVDVVDVDEHDLGDLWVWHIWDHSQSISLQKLGIKHVSYMFLIILKSSMSCFHWGRNRLPQIRWSALPLLPPPVLLLKWDSMVIYCNIRHDFPPV